MREREFPDPLSDFEREVWEKVKILRSLRSTSKRLITRVLDIDIGSIKGSLLIVNKKLVQIGHLSVSVYIWW